MFREEGLQITGFRGIRIGLLLMVSEKYIMELSQGTISVATGIGTIVKSLYEKLGY